MTTRKGREMHALVIDDGRPEHATLFVPLSEVPRRATFVQDDRPVQITVINADPLRGYALLLASSINATRYATPIAAAAQLAIGSELQVERRNGQRSDPVTLVRRDPDGRFAVDRDLTMATILRDDSAAAVGYALGGRRVLPLGAALPWLDQHLGRPLAELQSELRSTEPPWLLIEADEWLATRPVTAAANQKAIELSERAASLSRDRETIEAAQQRLQVALHNKLRLEAEDDPLTAIASARDALNRFPNHAGIATDLVHLLARHGDAAEATIRFRRLRAVAPEHTNAAAAQLAEALQQRAHRATQSGLTADALTILASAVELFPQHGKLRIAYAHALRRAGDRTAAAQQARQAINLDPNLTAQAEALLRTSTENEVVIPFDPRTNVINTTASVAGTDVRFVVDTGASLTTIPVATARALGLKSSRKITVNTASGQATGEVVMIPWLQIGTIRLRRVRAVVIDLPNQLANQGLLGLNALGRLHMQIDGTAGIMTLRRKKSRKR